MLIPFCERYPIWISCFVMICIINNEVSVVNSQNSSITFDNSGFFGFSFSNGSIVPFKEFEHQDTYAKVGGIKFNTFFDFGYG